MAKNNAAYSGELKRTCSATRCDSKRALPSSSTKPQNTNQAFYQIYESEYNANYKQWESEPRKPIRQEATLIVGEQQQFGGDSSCRQIFVKHPVEKCEEIKKEVYVKPTSIRQTRTIYKNDYTDKFSKHHQVTSYKPSNVYHIPTVKFIGNSIYKSSYPQYDRDIARQSRPKAAHIPDNLTVPLPSEKVEQPISTSREDFRPPVGVTPPKSILPTENSIQETGGEFDSATVYKQTFVGHRIPEPIILVKAPNKLVSHTNTPFTCITTNMADYKNHGTVARESAFRPSDATGLLSELPFQCETTQSDAYRAWPIQARVAPPWGKEKEYKKVAGKLILSTTYSVDYKHPGVVQKAPACRPETRKGNLIKQGGALRSRAIQTTYNSSYPTWAGVKPATPCLKDKKKYTPPTKPMETTSTQKSHYTGHVTERATLCRHPSQHRELATEITSPGFNTTYRDTYVSH